MIPFDSVRFIGRDKELEELQDALSQASSRRCSAVLHGMGGVGKTSIAVEFGKYPDTHFTSKWWINCTSKQTIAADLHKIGQKLLGHYIGILGQTEAVQRLGFHGFVAGDQIEVGPDTSSQDRFFSAIQKWFLLKENTKWLVVFDSADDKEFFNKEVVNKRLHLPESEHGAILITTQVREIGYLADRRIMVGELPQPDGLKLFRAYSHFSPKGLSHRLRRNEYELMSFYLQTVLQRRPKRKSSASSAASR